MSTGGRAEKIFGIAWDLNEAMESRFRGALRHESKGDTQGAELSLKLALNVDRKAREMLAQAADAEAKGI